MLRTVTARSVLTVINVNNKWEPGRDGGGKNKLLWQFFQLVTSLRAFGVNTGMLSRHRSDNKLSKEKAHLSYGAIDLEDLEVPTYLFCFVFFPCAYIVCIQQSASAYLGSES